MCLTGQTRHSFSSLDILFGMANKTGLAFQKVIKEKKRVKKIGAFCFLHVIIIVVG